MKFVQKLGEISMGVGSGLLLLGAVIGAFFDTSTIPLLKTVPVNWFWRTQLALFVGGGLVVSTVTRAHKRSQ